MYLEFQSKMSSLVELAGPCGDAHCKLIWEEMCGKPLAEGGGNVIPNDAPNSGGHANGDVGLC